MSKFTESQEINDEIKDILEYDDYSIYTDLDIEQNRDSKTWNVSFKLSDVLFRINVRFQGDGADRRLEYCVHEDIWEELKSFDHTAKRLPLYLLFEACGRLNFVRSKS